MQGKKRFRQALFVSIDLDKFIPEDHRLRKIDRILDFSFVHSRSTCIAKTMVGQALILSSSLRFKSSNTFLEFRLIASFVQRSTSISPTAGS